MYALSHPAILRLERDLAVDGNTGVHINQGLQQGHALPPRGAQVRSRNMLFVQDPTTQEFKSYPARRTWLGILARERPEARGSAGPTWVAGGPDALRNADVGTFDLNRTRVTISEPDTQDVRVHGKGDGRQMQTLAGGAYSAAAARWLDEFDR